MIVQIEHYKTAGDIGTCPSAGCLYSNYLHLGSVAVIAGNAVTKGDLIGYSGASASGFAHLHFEIRDGGYYQKDCVNPWGFLPYTDTADNLSVTIATVDFTSPLAPTVTVDVSSSPGELDFNAATVDIFDLSTATPNTPIATQTINFNEWNKLYTPTVNPLPTLDDPNFNNMSITPAQFNASTATYDIALTFKGLSILALPPAGSRKVTVTVADVLGNAVLASIVPDVPNDFNNDGMSDLLWRKDSTGANYVWQMNGTTKTGCNPGNAGIAWSVAGTGNFDGLAGTDILWRHNTTGWNQMWFMNGCTKTSLPALGVATTWSVAAIGDFDNDGKSDILWRKNSTGANYVWLMNGTTKTTGCLHSGTSTTSSVVGTGDFDSDGTTDILWNDSATGANSIWFMNGCTKTTGNPGASPASMSVARSRQLRRARRNRYFVAEQCYRSKLCLADDWSGQNGLQPWRSKSPLVRS